MSFFEELKRRNVVKVAILYVVATWILLQVTDVLSSLLPVPEWTGTLVLVLLLVGFPIVLIFSWVYELTPGGIKRETEVDGDDSIPERAGRRINALIIVLLGLVIALFALDRLIPRKDTGTESSAVQDVSESNQGNQAQDDTSTPVTARNRSIAVLPFINMSADSTEEYFSDGISAHILNTLSGISGVNVVARTSSFSFKNQNKSIQEIASLLNIEYILDGSVFRSGDRIRITAQVVDADSGFNIWSNSYDEEASNLFEIQDDITASIVSALQIEVFDQVSALGGSGLSSIDAYDLYLLAREKPDASLVEKAAWLDQALDLDPDFTEALAYRAFVEIQSSDYSFGARAYPVAEVLPRAKQWLDRARRLDPTAPETLAAVGLYNEAKGDVFSAEANYRDALRQRPNFTEARSLYARTLGRTSRVRDAITQLEKALAYDPANANVNISLFDWTVMVHDLTRAESILDRWQELAPDESLIALHRARYLLFAGQLAASLRLIDTQAASAEHFLAVKGEVLLNLAEYERVIEEVSRSQRGEKYEVRALTLLGRHGEAVAVAEELQADRPGNRWPVDELLRSLFYAERWDEYVALLERNFDFAYDFRDYNYFPASSVAYGPYQATQHQRFDWLQQVAWGFLDETEKGGYGKPEIHLYAARLLVLDGREDEAMAHLQLAVEKNLFTPRIPVDPVLARLSYRADYRSLVNDIERRINEQRAELDLPPVSLTRLESSFDVTQVDN